MDKQLFELNPNPVLIYDPTSLSVLEANQAFLKKYRYQENEIADLSIDMLRPEAELDRLKDELAKHRSKSIVSSDVFRHRSKNNDIFYVTISSHEYRLNGRDARMVFIHDVTDRIKAEKEAEATLDELRHHISNSPLGMVKWNADFKIIDWSERAEESTGYSKEDVLGKSPQFFEYYSKEEWEEVQTIMQSILSGETDQSRFDYRMYAKDGSLLNLRAHISVLRNEDRSLKSVLMFLEDITRQNKMEIRYQRLFESANDGIFLMEGDVFIACNQEVCNIFGCSKKEILGKNPADFSPEYQPDGVSSREKSQKVIDRAFKEGPQKFFWKHRKKDGTLVDTEVSLNSLSLGERKYVQAVVRDISDQKIYEKQLKKSLEEKRVLISEIHHRVKNNLAIVSGLLQMQVLSVDDPRLTNYLQNSQLRIQSMALVHEMLYQSSEFSEIKMDTYIEKLVHMVADTLNPEDKSISVNVKSDDFVLNINQAIPSALCINELVNNCFEFAFEEKNEGTINVELTMEGEAVTVEVKDDGIGLPDNFEEMRKTSLGMSLVDNLMIQLETEINIETGSWGTSFSFTFEKDDVSGSSSSGRV